MIEENHHNKETVSPAIRDSQGKASTKVGSLRMLMRLAVGGLFIGREVLKNRYQEQQSDTHISAVDLDRVTPIESTTDQARYAAVGAIASSSEAMRRSISTLRQVSDRSYGKLTRLVQPVTQSQLLKPLRRRYQHYLDHGDRVVSAWMAAGRREEYLGRQLAEHTAIDTIEETLDYLAISPEMDELVAQQSADLVDDIFLEDIRNGASTTSMIVTRWFNSVVLRRKRNTANESPSSPVPRVSQDE